MLGPTETDNLYNLKVTKLVYDANNQLDTATKYDAWQGGNNT